MGTGIANAGRRKSGSSEPCVLMRNALGHAGPLRGVSASQEHRPWLVARAVSKQSEWLRGTPSRDKDGRFDLVVGLPGFGKVYIHILVWFHYHNDGQFNSWKGFKGHCLRTGQDVDQGEKGERQRHADGWRTVIDVQSLS